MALLDDNALRRVWAKIKAGFVAKESGKGLSSNDYTSAEKDKLSGIAAGANAYTHPSYTAQAGAPASEQAPDFGDTFVVGQVTSNASGHVTGITAREVTMPSTLASESNDGLMGSTDKDKLDAIPSVVGVFARNIGDIEGELETVREENAGIIQALAVANVRALNTPNLLDPNAWWTNSDGSDIIYGDATQYGGPGAYMDSIANNRSVTFDHEPTAEESAGAYRIYHRTAGEDSSGNTWTEAWIVSWQVDDSIATSCVTLTGDDIVTEETGESFNKAIQYSITANTAYGNTENLLYPRGLYQRVYDAGKPPNTSHYEVPEMEVGETYTMSCWARVISGGGALLKFGWGGTYWQGTPGMPSGKAGASGWIELKSTDTAWRRLTWSFVFAPEGQQYTESTADGKTTRTYDWQKRVIFGMSRKYTSVVQLCGFRLTKHGLYGDNTVDTLAAEVEDARKTNAQNTAQVATVTSQISALLASVAKVEANSTASSNYSAGDLLVLGGRLYKASAAIVSGDTLAAGTNITATTLAAELAALNA